MATYLEHNGKAAAKVVEPITVSTGVSDSGKMIQTNAAGTIDPSFLPPDVGEDTNILEASEDMAAGDFVNIWNDAGTAKVRKADATTEGMECDGFILTAVTSGNTVKVYDEGTNNQLSGLTPGVMYYLGTTAGQPVDTPPNGSGNVNQRLGKSVSATAIAFERQMPITLA